MPTISSFLIPIVLFLIFQSAEHSQNTQFAIEKNLVDAKILLFGSIQTALFKNTRGPKIRIFYIWISWLSSNWGCIGTNFSLAVLQCTDLHLTKWKTMYFNVVEKKIINYSNTSEDDNEDCDFNWICIYYRAGFQQEMYLEHFFNWICI
jgi:hypothetical protein